METVRTNIFDYKIIRRERRKTASLQVSPANEVSILVPTDLQKEKIEDLIKRKTPWILSKIKFNQEVKYPHKPKEFLSGEAITYLGRNYRLKVIYGKTESISLKNGRFVVTILKDNKDEEKAVKELLHQWFVLHAEKKLLERARRLKDSVGVSYDEIKVKSLKQRWGSCTRKGVINFNWRIIIAPISIVDYVVAHELCHRIHHDHSKAFWRLFECVMPDYRERKEWLRVNGAMLNF